MTMNDTVLVHHGIKGMKWGVRRFQKADGSLTSAGKARYGGDGSSSDNAKMTRAARSHMKKAQRNQELYDEAHAKTKQLNARDKASGMDKAKAAARAQFRKEADDEWKEMRDIELRRAKRTQEYHDNAKQYWDRMSTGKKVGTVLLYGPWGAQQYSALKGSGSSTAVAFGATTLSNMVAGPLGNTIVNNLNRKDYADK